MGDKPTDFDAIQLLRICHMRVNLRMKQGAIAEKLNLSKPTVARRLAEAREKGWIKQPEFEIPDEYAYLEGLESDARLEHRVLQALKTDRRRARQAYRVSETADTLEKVTVVPTAEEDEESRERVGHAMARLLESKFAKGRHVVAVNYGRTTEACAKALLHLDNPEVRFFPAFGDLGIPPADRERFEDGTKIYSNTVVWLMATKFNATDPPPVHLTGQGFIHHRFRADRELIREYVEQYDASFQEVFAYGGLMSQAGTFLTGLGAPDERSAGVQYCIAIDLREAEQTQLQWQKGHVVGDIGGTYVGLDGFLPAMDRILDALDHAKPGTPVDRSEILNKLPQVDINRMVLGLWPGHFVDIARRKANDNVERDDLGVVVATAGDRADIVLAAVRSDVVNHLIIDEALANHILSRVESSEAADETK